LESEHVIRTEIITDLGQINPQHWEALLARCPDSTIFQSRGWITSWWTAFARSDMQVHSIAAYDAGDLVGLALLYLTSRRVLGLRLAELRFIGEGPSDYNLFSVRDGAPEIVDRLMEEVRRELSNGVAVMLADVPQFSTLAFCLSAQHARRLTGLRQVSTTPCPRLRLRGNSSGVAATLKKDSLRRHFKALSKIGPIVSRHHSEPESILALLPDLYRQHVARWSGTDYPSLFLGEASRKFYETVAESLGREGKIALTEVRAGERLAALHFGLRSRDEFIWYKPAFDPALTRQGPGEVLLKTLIEYAQADGYSAFDFSRGDESFKSRFATSVDYNGTYEWIPPHVPHVFLGASRRVRRNLSHYWRAYKSRDSGTTAENASATKKRLLLLDLPTAAAGPLIASLAAEGFEVDVASTEPLPARERDSRAGNAYELPNDPNAALATLRALDRGRKYELLVPFSEKMVPILGSLSVDDPLNLKSAVAVPATLEAADREFPPLLERSGLPTAVQAHGDGNRLDAPRQRSFLTVQCLCAHGRLAWYRVLGDAQCVAGPSAWVVPQSAKRLLERFRWHGFATLMFDVAVGGRLSVRRIAPILELSEADVDVVARFVASAWAMVQLRRVAPQPREFMRSAA
jgi:CelD/BcsL family acetyltransferase involved in cellulose biosynthesis